MFYPRAFAGVKNHDREVTAMTQVEPAAGRARPEPGSGAGEHGRAGAGGRLAGRVALVSGVARPPGIGRATALRLAAAGASVVCADLVVAGDPADTGAARLDVFERVVAEVRAAGPGEVLAAGQHGTNAGAWRALVDATLAGYGRLDICCALNGATGAPAGDGPLLDLDERSWQRCLDVNLTASWLLLRSAARAMVAGGRPGALVALSSHAATVPTPGVGALGAARSGVEHLVAVLAQELAPHGIRCNAVSPLAVAGSEQFPNPGLAALAAGQEQAWIARTVPLGRPQRADETAAVVEFLCSDDASYLTGATIPVSGGAR
jgi:NAD(P)-dependent dehydrogenase (short-subunit alcohol dehydrogenase family)